MERGAAVPGNQVDVCTQGGADAIGEDGVELAADDNGSDDARAVAQRQWDGAQAYSESKLHLVALALAAARAWPEVLSNAVDPGWVPTRMGGPGALDALEMGHLTQTWLAVSNDPAAVVSGGYWYHRQRQRPAAEARDPAFQDQLMTRLAALTGVKLF